LEDLEQQVADFTDEVQQLVGCTSETISFEVNCLCQLTSASCMLLAEILDLQG
jgi:hypothetical protein